MRLALDTNVWTYLAEQGAGDDFASFAERIGARVVVPPATILEAARTPLEDIRFPLLKLLGSVRFEHSRTEAAEETEEWIQAARRLRPAWIRRFPLLDLVARLDSFWTRRLPRAARRGEPALHEAAKANGEFEREYVAGAVKWNRALREPNQLIGPMLGDLWASPADFADPDAVLGAGVDEKVEAWRLENATYWWRVVVEVPKRAERVRLTHELAGVTPPVIDTTLWDWAEPWLVDTFRRDRADWNRFWYKDVLIGEVPRNWLRWAISHAQADFGLKGATGLGGDQQLTSYLSSVDAFITADRRFARALDAVRPHAPTPFAEAIVVEHNTDHQLRVVQAALESYCQVTVAQHVDQLPRASNEAKTP